jgi:phytoene dehydrogenase-like protein
LVGSYDALVIGGGHNGLVAAARLAKAGKRTLVLEAQERLGGLAASETLDGQEVPLGAHLLYAFAPQVERALDLGRHGLIYAQRDLATTAIAGDGRQLALGPKDASAKLQKRLLAFAGALAPFCAMPPPRPVDNTWGERWSLFKLALRLRRLGKRELSEFLRIVLLPLADLLNDELDDELLKAALAFDGLVGTRLAPRSPGGVLAWLYRLHGRAAGAAPLALPKGGVAALIAALEGAARAAGAEIRTGAPVARVLVDVERAKGVVSATGEEIAAEVVLSTADPKRTFLEFLGPRALETGTQRQVERLRARGMVAKLDLIADGLPEVLGQGRVLLLDHLDALEESFDGAKYGEAPKLLAAELVAPGLLSGERGSRHLSAILTYVPTRCREPDGRARIEKTALALLEGRFPGLTGRLAASRLLLPEDYETRLGLAGGDWHQGETTIEQLFFLRPFAEAAQYATPIAGLYLAGAGAHPGGHLTGLPGWNAAGEALKEKRA